MRGCALLLILPLVCPQEKPKLKLEWKAEPGSVLEYEVVDAKTNKPRPEGWFVFASELRKNGNRIAIDRYADLAWPLLFRLPKDEVRQGQSWEHEATFFAEAAESTAQWGWGGSASIKPCHVRGRYLLRKVEKKEADDLAWIDGEFTIFEIRRDFVNNQPRLTVTKSKVGTVSTSAAFHTGKGVIEQAAFVLDVPRAQERVREKEGWRVSDRRLKESFRAQLKETVKLEAVKMEKAVQAGLKRAIEWLRKQQKPGGEFGTARTLETDRADTNYTGLVARALLAAGVPADDEAFARALRSLRSGPGPRTPQTYAHLAGAVIARAVGTVPWPGVKTAELRAALRKDLPVEDASLLRAAADTVSQMRERKTGGWGTGAGKGIETSNTISTRHAVEAVFLASLGGVPASQETARAVLDLLSGLAVEESDEIELQVEFVEGFRGIEPEPKKASPATWRMTPDRGAKDPGGEGLRGNAFTTLCAMESCALLRAAAPLSEAQKRTVDSALRRGLAWIQRSWTLRTPPPAEASWSVQKEEYLCALMRVLTALGVRTVAGCDWYLEGAYLLLRSQYADGSWDSSGGAAVVDTVNAVLFLARSAMPLPPAE
ncbi:MAG: hypothetical protein HYY17_01015 [Planctomycetes bacterium]|nr:hypothetical protein [Planctomycetota bacterium]